MSTTPHFILNTVTVAKYKESDITEHLAQHELANSAIVLKFKLISPQSCPPSPCQEFLVSLKITFKRHCAPLLTNTDLRAKSTPGIAGGCEGAKVKTLNSQCPQEADI